MSTNKISYIIRPYEPPDWAKLMELVKVCYGNAAESPEWWKWRHFELKGEHSEIYLAVHDDMIIGMRPKINFPYTLKNRTLVGTIFSDVMVHPNFRRRGVFRSLIDAAVESAWEHGADFISTMPNDLSYPVYKKCFWQDPGDRTLMVRPLNLITAAQSKVRYDWLGALMAVFPQLVVRVLSPTDFHSALILKQIEVFDRDTDEMAERIATAYAGLILKRNSSWLNWRYKANPWNKYTRFDVRTLAGLLKGIAVTNIKTRQRIRIGYLVELLGETVEARRSLITAAVNQLEEKGAQVVISVMSDKDVLADLRNQGFMKISGYLSPKKFHVVYIVHPEKVWLHSFLQKIENWYQTLGDWDVI